MISVQKFFLATVLCLSAPLAMQAGDGREEAKPQPFSRGFSTEKQLFIPKGTAGFGISATFSGGDMGQDAGYSIIPSLIGDIAGSYRTYGFSPAFEYFIGDNLSLGFRLDYKNTSLNIDSAALSIMEDMSFSVSDLSYRRHTYLGSLAVRYYVPFMTSKIFGWFVEGRLTGGYAQSKEYKTEDGLKHGVYSENWQLRLGAYPGVCFFVAENVDFEVQVGLADFGYQHVRQVENQVNVSTANKWDAKGAIDLLAISFGARFYFLDKLHKPAR